MAYARVVSRSRTHPPTPRTRLHPAQNDIPGSDHLQAWLAVAGTQVFDTQQHRHSFTSQRGFVISSTAEIQQRKRCTKIAISSPGTTIHCHCPMSMAWLF